MCVVTAAASHQAEQIDVHGHAPCRTWDNARLASVRRCGRHGCCSGRGPYELDGPGQVFSVDGSCHLQDQVQLDDLYDLTCSKLEGHDSHVSLNSEFYYFMPNRT